MPGSGPYRLPRSASLKRRTWIRALFDRGRRDVHSVARGCIRIVFRIVEAGESTEEAPFQVGFSPGPGKAAVKRNRIKRLLRESYRVNQDTLDVTLPKRSLVTMMILYRHRDVHPFDNVARDMRGALKLVNNELGGIE